MKTPFGWTGTVLHINLTTQTVSLEHPDTEIYRTYLGGRGMAGHFLAPHATRHWTDPALPLLIFTGPLTGTAAPTSGRGTIMSRSPLTGAICDCSVGGTLATHLKHAGYDGLIITGHSDTPCGIEISDADVRIVPTPLWGTPIDEVFAHLESSQKHHRAMACIGPAAENGSRLASIVIDRHHAAARGGLGLIWATKHLKYLTVHGTGEVPVHDPHALDETRTDIMRLTAASPVLMGQHGFSEWGTGALFDLMDSRNMMPTDNFQKTRWPHARRCNVVAFHSAFTPTSHGCSGCHIRCKKIARNGRTMPDYEAMAHFTALIDNPDKELALSAHTLCGQLGLDPISTGATLACFREHTGEDFSSTTLLDTISAMAHDHALGQGSRRYAKAHGHPEWSMSVKGMELPAYDPRGAYGMALAYATNTRGGCHSRANALSHEILRKPVATDRFSFNGKARIIKLAEDLNAVVDSLTACRYTFLAASLEEYTKAFIAVTGVSFSGQDLLEIGERIIYNERIMNAAHGFSATDDDLPARFFTDHGTSGRGIAIPPLNRDEFYTARSRYYRIRGLDENGLPTPDTTRRLGLDR
ncbi:aldehyde ferredoxin oxidoreductase [Pseudodesulfovibrio sp. JC047]|uniref:aldehyde ferredoxin oxidoreductase family protein n=1 Tax=Pseudodesulfovibrio sp. JC047 TaxID=2683199 RepID=UPI0013D8400B|nr:aldehyde ferredoxin oxidoreductase C-terminal domain-containing protein [Pseudodesulfovibrio sp. JC047]NDV19597.1 aldehyde ferredoxin oxidoreductase [Pseudodesulfovibrio sp. JC047]